MSLRDLNEAADRPIGPDDLTPPDPDRPFSIRAIKHDILDLYHTGFQPGVAPPWITLTPHYTIKEGQVTVVTGIPHCGKSPFVNEMAIGCAVNHGWPVAFCSPEHLPYEDLSARLLQQFYKNLSFSPHPLVQQMTQAEVMNAVDSLGSHIFFVPMSEANSTIPFVLARCIDLVESRGLKGLVIDPYGEFEHKRPSGMSETEYVSQLLTSIRLFARRYKVHVWLVAHPVKMQKKDDGKYPVVNPYDIAGSAAFANKPDNILSIHREYELPDLTQVHIFKIKFREVGKRGVVTLRHDSETGAFHDIVPQTNIGEAKWLPSK